MSSCPDSYILEDELAGGGSGDKVLICEHEATRDRLIVKPISADRSPNMNECMIFRQMGQFCDNRDRAPSLACSDREFSRCEAGHRLAVGEVNGIGLDQIIARGRRPLFAEWAPIAASLIEAVHDLWRRGVTHRDIKPANIIIGPDGRSATLIDLGTACIMADADVCLRSAFGSKTFMPVAVAHAVTKDIQTYRDRRQTGVFLLLAERYGSVSAGLMNVDAFMAILTIYCLMRAVPAVRPPAMGGPRLVRMAGLHSGHQAIARLMRDSLRETSHEHMAALRAIYELLPGHRRLVWSGSVEMLRARNVTYEQYADSMARIGRTDQLVPTDTEYETDGVNRLNRLNRRRHTPRRRISRPMPTDAEYEHNAIVYLLPDQ